MIKNIMLKKNPFWEKGAKKGSTWRYSPKNMCLFLEGHGFCRYKSAPGVYVFVRIQNNVASLIDVTVIRNFLVDFMRKQDPQSIFKGFEDRLATLTSGVNMGLLRLVEINFFQDTHSTGTFFFHDKILRLEKNRPYSYLEYSELNQVIWASSIIERNAPKQGVGFIKSEFVQFINNAFPGVELQRLSRQSIGYMLHAHNDRGFSPALIITDNNSEDDQQGGTGKSLVGQAIGKFIKIASEDGKTFNPTSQFAYQSVTVDSRCILIEDCLKGLRFEYLFKMLTDGLRTERKGKDKVEFSFEQSPKVLLTSNHAIGGSDQSHERRRIDLYISDHYGTTHTPRDEFGHLLFSGWNETQWELFDSFMVSCLQLFLDSGVQKVVNPEMIAKRLAAETHEDFAGFLESNMCKRDIYHSKTQMLDSWVDISKVQITQTKFTKWLIKYQEVGEYILENNRTNGSYRLKSAIIAL